MGQNVYEIAFYCSFGAFAILFFWFIIKSRINKSFRNKSIELLKKQKSQLKDLKIELDTLTKEKEDLRIEKIKNEQQLSNQSKKFSKIGSLINPGLSDIILTLSSQSQDPSNDNISEISNYVHHLNLWYQAYFSDQKPPREALEITGFIHDLSDDLTHLFSGTHLNFLHHISEPIEVDVNTEMVKYIFFHIGRIMGERSVSGNTIYIDTERTGKKCLITFEDAGPGIDDSALKSLMTRINNQDSMKNETHPEGIPLIFIRDFIEWHDGKLWLSTIQEIGIKFTFSLPLIN